MQGDGRLSLVSSERKLLYNCRNLLDFREGGPCVPVTFFVSPTNRCQLRCPQCLYGGKDNALELDTDALARFVECTATMGVKAWELTGGGEPLLYPSINDLLRRLAELGIAVGLMTNGLALDRLDHPEDLRWIRVSLHGMNQDEKWLAGNIHAVRGTVKTTCCWLATEANLPQLGNVWRLARDHGWTVKIEVDWFLADRQKARQLYWSIDGLLDGRWGCYPNVFLDPQVPEYNRRPGPCYMHLVKPFLYSDGWVYSCPCAVGPNRDVAEEFRVCRMEDVTAYYLAPPKSVERTCQVCKYQAMNAAAEAILEPLEDLEFC